MNIHGRSFAWGGLLALCLIVSGGAAVELEDESILVSPLHLGEEQPPLRSLRVISLGFGEGRGRTREEASAQLAQWIRVLGEGALAEGQRAISFRELVLEVRAAAGVGGDGVLGSFPSGVLMPGFEQFLWEAEVGDVSDVIEAQGSLHLVQRVETYAAVRQLFLEGRDASVRARLLGLRDQVVSGVSFSDLAREHSMDLPSAARGGDYAVFERGPRDAQLKRAAFQLELGELSQPVETPLGWHLLQRVDPTELSPGLLEENWARFRGVLITHAASPLAANPERSLTEARALTSDIQSRLEAGEPFAPIASFSNDDPGGRARAGDLGWVHRKTPGLPSYLTTAFLLDVGEVGPPTETQSGWIIIRRER